MVRDDSKPIAIKIHGVGFSFTCSISGAKVSSGNFVGRDFFAYGEDVDEIEIIMLSAYKGAKRYGLPIYNSLRYMRNWKWESKDEFEIGALLAERKKTRALRKARHITITSEDFAPLTAEIPITITREDGRYHAVNKALGINVHSRSFKTLRQDVIGDLDFQVDMYLVQKIPVAESYKITLDALAKIIDIAKCQAAHWSTGD